MLKRKNYISKSDNTWFGIRLLSDDGDDCQAHLWLNAFGYLVTIFLPNWIIKPSSAPLWEDGVNDIIQRNFGFLFIEDSLCITYGDQEGLKKRRRYFDIPWMQRTHTKYEYLDKFGGTIAEVPAYSETEIVSPTTEIYFEDFDG